MGQCTHPDCLEQASPGSNRCATHAMEGSRSEKMAESAVGGLDARGRAPTGGYGSIYGYATQEFKASKNRSWMLAVVIVVIAVVAYVVLRMMGAPQGP